MINRRDFQKKIKVGDVKTSDLIDEIVAEVNKVLDDFRVDLEKRISDLEKDYEK